MIVFRDLVYRTNMCDEKSEEKRGDAMMCTLEVYAEVNG